MAETSFGVTYEGPALDDGRMPVRDLAPALLALGTLFTEASTTLYPDRPPVALDIHATKEGSFSIDLILTAAEGAWEATEQLFGGDGLTALVNLKEIILGGGTIGLIELIKIARGRSVEVEEEAAAEPGVEPGHVKVNLPDGASLEVPEQVLKLHGSMTVRENVQAVVRPLERDGVERFKASTEKQVTVSVGKEDLPAFHALDPPEEEEELEETERTATVQIAGIYWGGKWRLTEGAEDSGFYASIEDEEFKEKIQKGAEVFREGDLLECVLRTKQRKVGTQLRGEHRIVKVTKHIAATEQLNLDGSGPDSEPDVAAA